MENVVTFFWDSVDGWPPFVGKPSASQVNLLTQPGHPSVRRSEEYHWKLGGKQLFYTVHMNDLAVQAAVWLMAAEM